jgi:hypothetical protein
MLAPIILSDGYILVGILDHSSSVVIHIEVIGC